MSTGSFENWAGTITDIGPLYPFVGTEVYWFILGLVFWIWWHVVQAKRENQEYKEQIERFGSPESLKEIISRESPEDP